MKELEKLTKMLEALTQVAVIVATELKKGMEKC
jgi:hypothetical protein